MNDLRTVHDSVPEEVQDFLKIWLDDNDYIEVKTSGSTGSPKSIRLFKKNMIASAKTTNRVFNLSPNDVVFCPLPARYIAGKMMIVRALTGQLNLYYTHSSSNPLQDIPENQIFKFGVFTPHQLTHILDNEDTANKINQFEQILLGGSRIDPSLLKKIQSLQPTCFIGFGMTETMSHVAIKALNGPNKNDFYQACGETYFEQDASDCLIIHAPHLNIEGLKTTDVVQLYSSTSFKWKGRIDHAINSGGIKLHPELMEQKIHDLITEPFYIIGKPDRVYGFRPIIYIESHEPMGTRTLLEAINNRLDPYEKIISIRVVSQFKYTPNNKVKRILL